VYHIQQDTHSNEGGKMLATGIYLTMLACFLLPAIIIVLTFVVLKPRIKTIVLFLFLAVATYGCFEGRMYLISQNKQKRSVAVMPKV